MFETVRDHAGMVFLGLLVHPGAVFCTMFGNDYGKITGGKKERLISEKSGNSCEWHRPAVTAKVRKCLSFCNAIGVPSHYFFLPFYAH